MSRAAGPGEIVGRLVAFLVAGAVVTFTVAVTGEFLRLPQWLTVALIAGVLGVLAWRVSGLGRDGGPGDGAPKRGAARSAAARSGEEERMAESPLVGVVMGSASDQEVMQDCTRTLDSFGVPYEMIVASAHRQPDKVHEWAAGAQGRGIMVIVAAAGKAAHLGGAVAAFTPLPVIAVPIKTSDLGGLDSLLSMVQMPSGVPVACVAINGAKNAAILAVQILGTSMPEYRDAVARLKEDMARG